MEKNLEKSLKRYLKRKVKITTAFIVAFLLGSLAVYGATLDEIFANGELVKHSTKVGYEEKEFKIRYDKNNNSIVLEWSSGVWKKNSEIKIDSLNEVQKNSLLKSLEAFANSAQEELKPTTTENGINNGIILNIGDTETSSDPASAQEIASGVIINKGDIYSGGTVFITYSQNITGKNGVAVNDGNIYGIGSVGQKAFMGTVINNGNIFSNGQDIDNSVGINNGNIFLINKGWNNEAQGQEIKSNGIGVNAGNINSSYDDYSVTAQKIEGIGINVSDIFFTTNVSTVTGQKVASGVGINNKNIKLFSNKYDSMGQEIGGMGFNNGMISSEVSDKSNNGTAYGQKINTAGVGINNGVIYSSNANKDEEYGQTTDYNGVGINNGIIVADKAYYKRDYWSTFYKNGIALKKDDTGKLVINTGSDNYGEEYNKNIDILGKDKLTTSNKLSEVITNNNITQKDVGETSDGTKVKGYNLFINNLGNETDDSDKNNQLVIDTDLTGSFVNTHITTAVTNGNFDNNNGAVIKISKSGNTDKTFLMDKSTIAGYFEQNGTLADMTGATDITLSNSVISVSGKDNTIDTTAVKFGAGSTVALNSSTISGKIDFSAGGNNALNLNGKYNGDNNNSYKDGTQYGTYASDIEFGTGNDNIDIKFTETKDGNEVTDYNSSYDKKGLVTLGNVNFGDGNDTLSFSFDEMRKGNFVLAGDIDFGAGNDTVALKSKIDMNDKGETITLLNNFLFNKITKNQDGTSTLETLQLADTGNTIRFEQNIGQDKLSLDFNGKILGGSGEDIFVVDLDKIQNYDFDGKDGTDYIQITEKYDESKISSFEKFSERNIEGLKLGDFENTVDIDNLLADDKVKLTHLKGGNTGDTFIINGTDETKKNKVLGMVIGGGSSENDTLKVNTNITTEQLSSKTGIENLELGLNKDTGYNIDFTYKDNTDETKTLEDFKNIKSGNGDDNFTVSVDHFEKLFLIDGGGNKTAGDSLTINGDFKVVTNIKEDGTVDDTLFNKIQNIENLEFGSFTDAQLNLNNLTSEYLKNLAIKLGGLSNEIYISTSNLKELKGLTGTTNTALKITNAVTDRNDTFDFLAKGDGTKGINSIKKIYFSENDDTINLNNLSAKNSEITKIFGDAGNDTFVTSLETLGKIGQLDGGKGGERNSLEITDTLILNNETNPNVFENVHDIEKLVLSGTGNNIVIDNLVSSDPTQTFSEVIGIDGGENGNTFIIDGTDADKKDKVLEMKIEGGISSNDTLKVNTNISEEQLSNKTGIENLVLGNVDNTVDFTYKDQDKNLEDFKNITSGNRSDHFTVSADNIGNMTINGGGTVTDNSGNLIAKDHDILKLSGVLNNDKESGGDEDILKGISNIEELDLDNRENILNLDKLKLGTKENGFKAVYGGTADDTFKISAENLGKIDILKGEIQQGTNDNDRLEITTGNINETNKSILDKVKNIEELVLAENSSNNIDLDNLTFKNITAKDGNDTFKISADKLGNFTVTGGIGNDTLEIKTSLSDNESGNLEKYTGFETLELSTGGNEFTLDRIYADKNNFKNIIFAENSIGNTLTLTETLRAKNIEFKTFDKNNAVNVDIKEDVNKIKTFEHTVTNAGKIILEKGKFEWKFADNSTINGKNTVLDLNENTLNLLNNEEKISDSDNIPTDKIINSGNIGLENGNLIFGDLNFVADGKVEVTNGKIKIGFDSSVKFSNGANTKFTLNEGKEIAFGSGVTFTTPYNFIKVDGTNISVKQWNEYQGYNPDFSLYAGRYDEVLKKYNGTDKESIAVTNALNGFSEKNIFKFVTDKQGDKLVYYSDEDSTPYDTKVTGEDILIKTNPDTTKDQDMNLTFNNISSSGNIKIEVTGGKDNTVTFGNVEKDSDSFVSVNSIDGSSSTKDLTLNFNGKTNNADKIVINNQNSNKINISGNTTIKEITFGDGADNIYLGENSQNVTIDKINFGAGDDKINIGSTGTINLSNINLGAGDNKIYFRDISKVENFDIVKSDGDNGTNEIEITETKNNSDAFNIILAGADKDVEKITVWGENKLQITNDFSGELLFSESRENVIDLKTSYTGDIKFTKGENTVNISENGSIDGTKLYLAGSKNILSVNSGTVTNGITFEENSYGNKVIVSENGNIGKDIIFGTEKGTDDEFTIALKDNGIFDYNVTNADVINISGIKGEINFGENSSITSNSEITLNTNGGVIAFNINKNGNIISKNPFGNTSVKVNGDIKITLDSSVKFESLSDTIKLSLGNIKSDSILTSAFLNYNGREFSIKSAEELKAFGLGDYAFGNYEYAILNYNKAGYEGITSMLNNNSLTDISKALNKGIEQKDFYFYSDDREIKDKITLGNINIETSKDNQVTGENLNTDIKFENVTRGTANINFAQGTTNSVSFLDGVNISKIDGSSSNAGFTLNLDGINFSKSQDAKDNTEVVMSDYADTLNINSKLEGIGINTGDGEDIVNISSYVKNITLNTGAGNDTVNILSSANGIFDGDSGDNTLNIGAKTQTLSNENSQDEIVLNGEIKNFQDINLNQNTKLESSLKISQNNQSEKINLNLNGNSLFVDVDYTKKADDKVIGHALYDNGIKVDNSTGKVMIDTAKANDGTIISLGTVGNKTEFASTDKEHLLESGSSNHHIEMIDGDIVVKVNEHIMGDSETGAIEYAHLDKIYQSIVSADKIKEMAETTTLSDKTKDEAVKAQLEFYGKIYHSTPYAYSNDVSKKSADLITESIMNLKVMPEYKHWVFGGSIAGREADSDSNFYGSNHYNGIDIGKNEVSADTNIYGAYAFGKYGISENQSVGFAIAGTRSDTDISGNSKLEGDAVYISAFAEQNINNLKLLAGISYQHSFYDSTRNVSNDYQRMSVDKKYEDDLVSIFAGGKYSYHLGNNFFAEPNVKLSVTHIMQDSIDEGDNGGLTIETDKKDFTFVEGEVGIDLVKKINLSKGTLNLRAGTSLVYLLDGYQEEYLTGRITGSSKSFEMISPEDDRTKVKFTIGTEYEMTNGMFMNLHGNYTTSSHTEDYAVSFGAGYKF